MKISLNKIRFAGEHYETPDLVPDGVDELVKKIGAQLGAVEEVIPYGHKFDGVIIVKVVSCEKHPDADTLNVCRIDDGKVVQDVERGDDGLVQVVCGAPNVEAGMLAAWLPPGSMVPSTRGKDEFVLEARELRGEKSNGMLASPKELGIGDSHEGLLKVDVDVAPGTTFGEAYRAEGEAIIDIENKMFTHRPDCFGVLGVTREIAGIQRKPFKSPDWYTPQPTFPEPESEPLKLTVTNEIPELVPRFTAIVMGNIAVKPSPVWLQIVLSEVGIRPINNIVDYTNFWMLETGQPLHAYDYDKLKALSGGEAAIVVRNPKPGEKIKLLNDKEIEPRPEAIMIATDQQLIGVGGVMGGSETEVDGNTKNIILECATFDMYSIRRTSMAHGLFTDAVTRFTKGQSPLQNLAVLAKISDHIQEAASGKVASQVIDDNHLDQVVLDRNSLYVPVHVTTDFISARLGLSLTTEQMKQLLENVEFKVDVSADELTVTAPFWRTDIELREDVVEEIGRLYGYDHLPLDLPKRNLAPAVKDPTLELKTAIRNKLAEAGANEVLTYSFIHGDLMDKVGQDKTQAFQISNALSPDLQYYRLSLTPSLLEKVYPNSKAGYGQFALFEIGKVYSTTEIGDDGLPKDFGRVALTVTANQKQVKNALGDVPYYQAKKFAEQLLDRSLHFVALEEVDTGSHKLFNQMLQPYEASRSALLYEGEQLLGVVGEYKQRTKRNLKLPGYSAGFEIFLSAFKRPNSHKYTALPRFPKVSQDITLKIASTIAYQQLFDFTFQKLVELKQENSLVDLAPLDIFQHQDDKEHRQVTFRLEITNYDRTMTDKEVNALLDKVAEAAKTEFNAERI